MLRRGYNPFCDDLDSTLLERVTAIASWKINGVDAESGALRETSTRIDEMERRLNRGGSPNGPNRERALLHVAMKTLIVGMFFARVVCPSTKAYLMHKDKDRTFRRDFNVMKTLVDELRHLNENIKPRKMDISSAAAAPRIASCVESAPSPGPRQSVGPSSDASSDGATAAAANACLPLFSVLSISRFARGPRCSKSVTCNP